jgi:hypothetical protein
MEVGSGGARIAVMAWLNTWVECAGVELKVISASRKTGGKAGPVANAGSGEQVTVKIRNARPEWISVSLTHQAVIVEVSRQGQTLAGNWVEPGRKASFTLPRPPKPEASMRLQRLTTDVPQASAIGFVIFLDSV